MKNLIVTLSSLGLFACGMGNEPANQTQTQDELLALQSGNGTLLNGRSAQLETERALIDARIQSTLPQAQRGVFCTTEMVRPTAQGTIQSIPKLGVFGIAPVGNEVQSSYFRSNGVNEEYRRGIAEFYVPGGITSAVLQFREHRGWTSYPLPSDTHDIEVYVGNLELDPEDYNERGVLVGRFETDPNLEPSFANVYDLTKATQEIGGGKIGVRFALEGGAGSGTSFMDLALEVQRCRDITRE